VGSDEEAREPVKKQTVVPATSTSNSHAGPESQRGSLGARWGQFSFLVASSARRKAFRIIPKRHGHEARGRPRRAKIRREGQNADEG